MGAIAFLSPALQFLDNDAAPLNGGKVYTYIAGTTTPQATYTDSDLSVPNANPIILDSAGRCVIYVPDTTAIKVIVKDSDDVTLYTQDNISPAQVAS